MEFIVIRGECVVPWTPSWPRGCIQELSSKKCGLLSPLPQRLTGTYDQLRESMLLPLGALKNNVVPSHHDKTTESLFWGYSVDRTSWHCQKYFVTLQILICSFGWVVFGKKWNLMDSNFVLIIAWKRCFCWVVVFQIKTGYEHQMDFESRIAMPKKA